MFGIPSAKRVRREDLYSPRSSPDIADLGTDDADRVEREQLLKDRLAKLYGGDLYGSPEATLSNTRQNGEEDEIYGDGLGVGIEANNAVIEEEDGFEFRLFATPNTSPASAPLAENETTNQSAVTETAISATPVKLTRIILPTDEEDDEATGPGAFILPHRNPSYYFAPSATELKKEEFRLASVTGEDVQKWLGNRYWALEKPWRVKVLGRDGKLQALKQVGHGEGKGRSSDGTAPVETVHEVDEAGKKKKPGKKRRIILRIKERKVRDAKEKKEREKTLKDENEKEKRTRRNREKKVKRKLREKAKKLSGGHNELVGEEKQDEDLSEDSV